MSTIDRVIEMQRGGASDGDIVNRLRNEGVSTKEISDSLAQAKIKMAVSQDDGRYQESYNPQSAMMSQSTPVQYAEPQYDQYQAPQQYDQYQGQGYDQYQAPQQYDQYQGQGYDQGYGMGTDTISDISERIVSEKMRDVNQKIKSFSDFKNKSEEDMIDIKERIKKIETTITDLQKAIIGKIGEFGQSTSLIHRDMENLHETVQKLMNPLIDNYNELKKLNDGNQ